MERWSVKRIGGDLQLSTLEKSQMTTVLSAFLIANAGLLLAIGSALSILGLVGLSLFATDGEREIINSREEQDGLEAEHGEHLRTLSFSALAPTQPTGRLLP